MSEIEATPVMVLARRVTATLVAAGYHRCLGLGANPGTRLKAVQRLAWRVVQASDGVAAVADHVAAVLADEHANLPAADGTRTFRQPDHPMLAADLAAIVDEGRKMAEYERALLDHN